MRDLGRPGALSRQQPRRPKKQLKLRAIVVVLVLAVGIWALTSRLRRIADHATPASFSKAGEPTQVDTLPTAETVAAELDLGRQELEQAILASQAAEASLASEMRLRFGPLDPFETVAVRIGSGQTLVGALIAAGVPKDEANRTVVALKEHFDFRQLRVGDRFEGTLWLGEHLLEGTLYHGRLGRYRVRRERGKLIANTDPLSLTSVTTVVAGQVRYSLFEAIYAAGEKPSLIMAFIDLFSWDFDFNVATRSGDRFQMLVEKRYAAGSFYDYGPILAARYTSGRQNYEACWYDAKGAAHLAGYYHTDGSSIKGAFLRAPVKYSRISSGFTKSRLHPTLGIRRPHSGIDYAAPMGTPVYSVASGIVIDAGWMGGAGRAVRVRHPNGWITSYSHLSSIAVKRGEQVRQGQMLGRVGSSGHSTGPHLDYRIKINGQFVDPLKVQYPRGESVPAHLLADFQASCRRQLAQLDKGATLAAQQMEQ